MQLLKERGKIKDLIYKVPCMGKIQDGFSTRNNTQTYEEKTKDKP